jgi:hypothetical protein
MQGYNKGSMGPSITVNYNLEVEACIQGYSKGSMGLAIKFHYNG